MCLIDLYALLLLQCDTECGGGTRHRQIRCKNKQGDLVPDINCHSVKKQKHSKKCHRDQDQPCMTSASTSERSKIRARSKRKWILDWRVSEWKPVS